MHRHSPETPTSFSRTQCPLLHHHPEPAAGTWIPRSSIPTVLAGGPGGSRACALARGDGLSKPCGHESRKHAILGGVDVDRRRAATRRARRGCDITQAHAWRMGKHRCAYGTTDRSRSCRAAPVQRRHVAGACGTHFRGNGATRRTPGDAGEDEGGGRGEDEGSGGPRWTWGFGGCWGA
jgi:hypothetical protein